MTTHAAKQRTKTHEYETLAASAAILAVGIAGSVSAQNVQRPPSQQISDIGLGWGAPSYLYPYEEMIARLEDVDRRSWQTPEKVLDAMSGISGDITDKVVFDLGAGTGYFSRMLVNRGAVVIAADPDRRFLSYAMGRRDAEGISPDRLQLRPIPYDDPRMADAEADWVLVVNTWHMVADRDVYLEKMMAGLKPGGYMAIVNHQKRDTPHGPPIERRMSPGQTLQELEAAGLVPVHQNLDFSDINYLIIAKKSQ